MTFLDDARRAEALRVARHAQASRTSDSAPAHVAVSARYGAEDLEGASTLNPMTVAAAMTLQTALAFGQVDPNVRNPVVAAFQAAYNQSPEHTQILKVDGLWGQRSKAALALYTAPNAALKASVPVAPSAPSTPGPVHLRRGGAPPMATPAPATVPSSPATASLAATARTLSPQSSYDEIIGFQQAWNATGNTPHLDPDGLWGTHTAGVIGSLTGQSPAPVFHPAAPRAPSPPTFVSPPAEDVPALSSNPSTTPADVRPWIFGGTLALAGGLLAWAPWKRSSTPSRSAPTVRTAPAPRKVRA